MLTLPYAVYLDINRYGDMCTYIYTQICPNLKIPMVFHDRLTMEFSPMPWRRWTRKRSGDVAPPVSRSNAWKNLDFSRKQHEIAFVAGKTTSIFMGKSSINEDRTKFSLGNHLAANVKTRLWYHSVRKLSTHGHEIAIFISIIMGVASNWGPLKPPTL